MCEGGPSGSIRQSLPEGGLEMAGAREQKREPKQKNIVPIVIGIAAAAVLAAYLGLCAWVGGSRIMPNVSIAGVDVSGLDQAAARQKLERALSETAAQVSIELSYGVWSAQVDGRGVQADVDSSVSAAVAVGRGSFITRGAAYFSHKLGASDDVALATQMDEEAMSQLEKLLDQADQEVGGDVTGASYTMTDDALYITKGITGVAIDRTQAHELVSQALSLAMEQGLAGQAGTQQTVTLPSQEEPPREPDFEEIWKELSVEPQDATVDPKTYEVLPHVVGVDFDWQQAKAAYEQAAEGETVSVPLTLTQPKETQESLKSKLFADLLGEGTSEVGGSSNRKYNVKLSAQACNGVVLMPGEVFSYNNTTGSRSADKGYLPAPVYSGGASVDETGGGICQTSSTIYYAVLHTTLKVVERSAHMYATGYVPDGMDATVYYGSLDFRFENSTNYPIKLVTESYDKGGKRYLTVKIYGTNEDGRYAVPERTRYDYVEPTTKYVADESIPRGTTKVDAKQNPYTGRSAQTYRYVYEKDGTLVEKQDMGISKYKMRPRTVYYNPLDGDPTTWVNGKPASSTPAADPGTVTDPGTTTPSTTPDPGTTAPAGNPTVEPETPQETEKLPGPGEGVGDLDLPSVNDDLGAGQLPEGY